MASQIGICNMALSQFGIEPLTALDQETVAGKHCLTLWDTVRDTLLAAHFWGFAVKRVALSQLDTTPAFGFDYAYQLPADCLRVLLVEEDLKPYAIEGGMLLSDEDTVSVKYLAKITTPGNWPSYFATALAAMLAVELCLPLADSPQRYQLLQKVAQMKVAEAQVLDARQAYGQPEVDASEETDTWLTDDTSDDTASWEES